MHKQVVKNQSGAASLIVVIFVSIILSIMTVGFLRTSLNEQRQSTDFDLSQRAYYAAESGLEDARRAVGDYINGNLTEAELNGDQCAAPAGYDDDPTDTSVNLSDDPDFLAEYTCMFIDLTPSGYQAEFDSANQTKQITIDPVDANDADANFRTLTMRWHVNAAAPNGDGVVGGAGVSLRGTGDVSLPQFSAWGHPAMMEVSFIAFPNANITDSSIVDSTIFVSPNSGGAGSSGAVFVNGPLRANSASDKRVLAANCNPSVAANGYTCEMQFDFTGFPANHQVAMRMTNRYVPTTLELSMTSGANGTGAARFFDNTQASVDITGESGSVLRRVEAALDLNSPTLLPDYTIQSITDICKDFSFTDDASEFGGIANTSCTTN